MARPISTYSIVAVDLDGGAVGSRSSVEVPLRRLGRPVGRAARSVRSRRRRTRIRVTGRTGSSCSAKASLPRRSSTSSRAKTRAATTDSWESSTRRATPPPTRARSASTGPAAGRARATRRRGTSSSRARRSTRWPRPSSRAAGSLAVRLIDCLAAAQAAGGDSRGQQSSALLVVQRDGGYAGMSDTLVELRVEDHERPIEELRRIYTLARRDLRDDAARGVARRRRRAGRRAAGAARQARLRRRARGRLHALDREGKPRGPR